MRKPRSGVFLRAQSYSNLASELGRSLLDLVTHRFQPDGLYILDEPEAALSVRGCLAVLAHLTDLVAHGSQAVIATRSPVLLAPPDALICETPESGQIDTVDHDSALPVRPTGSSWPRRTACCATGSRTDRSALVTEPSPAVADQPGGTGLPLVGCGQYAALAGPDQPRGAR